MDRDPEVLFATAQFIQAPLNCRGIKPQLELRHIGISTLLIGEFSLAANSGLGGIVIVKGKVNASHYWLNQQPILYIMEK